MSRALRSILLVEDDPDIQEIAVMALEMVGGYQVSVASLGAEALEKAPALKPDLIILDYMMPHMDGGQVLAALRNDQRVADIPVVFMTAKIRADEVARFRDMGAVDVLPKPFDPLELPARLEAIWTRIHS